MTVFDIMPAMWLAVTFLFFLFYALGDVDAALCAFCATVLSLGCALCGLPIFIQSAMFVCTMALVGTSSLCVWLYYRKKNVKEYTAVALTDVTSQGGYAKCNGTVISVKSRDCCIKYRKGDVFAVMVKDGKMTMWAKY